MGAIFLAPVYILINFYVVRWMIRWMGACHRLFQTMAFRVSFVGIYIILATALLTGFLVKKPAPHSEAYRKLFSGYFYLHSSCNRSCGLRAPDTEICFPRTVYRTAKYLCDYRTDLHNFDHCSQCLRNPSRYQCENHAL